MRRECPGEFEKLGERDGRTVVSACLICGRRLEEHLTDEELARYSNRIARLPEDLN
jgi:hypothetical protein